MSWGVATQNGVSVSLASIVSISCGATEFSPASLFTSGVVGAWYDPSDYSTLFQDSAGTTPVTAVEQAVRLMLDKSQGLVLGSEILTNGGFATDTDWTKGAGVTISGGTMNFSAATSNTFQREATEDNSGKVYEYTIVVSSVSGGNLVVGLNSSPPGSADFPAITAAGTYTYRRRYTGTTAYLYLVAAGFTGSIDSVSCKVVAGNHALAPNDPSRPILRARYNLLTYSEQFDNAAWTKTSATVSANATTAPDGTLTADLLTMAGFGIFQLGISYTAGTSYTFSFYAAPAAGSVVNVRLNGIDSGGDVVCAANASTGVITKSSGTSVPVFASTLAPNGFYRFTITIPSTFVVTGTNKYVSFETAPLGIYIWGADLRTGSSAGTYQRIAAATDYATAGFLPYLALSTDDSFGTNSIDFTATDKMFACVGVTKSSDATDGMLAELSSSYTTNPGSFYITAPEIAPGAKYAIVGRGAGAFTSDQLAKATSTTYNAPSTVVLTGIFNISGDSNNLRLNGTSIATAIGDQGAGNYGNYPLYIGRRNNATVPFNGNIYQMIVCGKTLSASELVSTEAYVATKTGVTL